VGAREGRPGRKRFFVIVLVVAVVGILAGIGFGTTIRWDLPDVRTLDDYSPPLMSRVLAYDGGEVASFAEQRRILIGSQDIPAVFKQALLSAEDSRFDRHTGLDFAGIARAAWSNLRHLRAAQGASTITQQLARNLFLKPDKTLRRKSQEAILAVEIERAYTKEEILRFYCNQVYMGHGRYGLEAASRFFFGKPARELTLPEAALLAGVIQRPEGLSPLKYPERATSRRNWVLSRMVREGFLTEAEAAAAQAAPLGVSAHAEEERLAPYFVEEVRRFVQSRFGEHGVFEAGLEIRTTLDPALQTLANEAVDRGLRQLDKRRGWRGVAATVPGGTDLETWTSPEWKEGVKPGEVTEGVVLSSGRGGARVRVADAVGSLGTDEVKWTGKRDASFLKPGDLVRVRLESVTASGNAVLTLEQDPAVEAALVAIEPATGEIKALVGGFDYRRSEFDRAIQAKRQTGSAFKPFVFAAALAAGRSLSDPILDEPTVFIDSTAPTPYQPENYGKSYYGLLTLREALEHSANIATVKLLLDVGFDAVLDMAKRLGIQGDLRPYPSLALGAFEVSLVELTSAYGTFANQGVRVEPHLVREVIDADGSVLFRAEPVVAEAVSPQIAYLMTEALEGVVTDGTGAAAASLGRPLAGKTGTTDDFTDAWFVGYSPDLVVGVWVGFDKKKSLGSRETGALAALPIWQTFMERAYAGVPPKDFPVPPGIERVQIDRTTGRRLSATAGCTKTFSEVFAAGTEPTIVCSPSEHALRALPYPFARYPLDDAGRLVVPASDLDQLLGEERSVTYDPARESLRALTATGSVTLPVVRTGAGSAPVTNATLPAAEPEAEQFRGADGRKARVVVYR